MATWKNIRPIQENDMEEDEQNGVLAIISLISVCVASFFGAWFFALVEILQMGFGISPRT